MTKQEQWLKTLRALHLIRKNYTALRAGNSYRLTGLKRRQMRELIRWLTVVDRVYDRLRRKKNKSPARARQDWLIARVIELTIYSDLDEERIRQHLTGPRPLTHAYIGKLTEAAALEIQAAAAEEGLFG
ncbi:MAG: hypothetical protein IJE08_07125 [Clostridia bacterium]|nr:hypothetical protein [Clostridia bacterium]